MSAQAAGEMFPAPSLVGFGIPDRTSNRRTFQCKLHVRILDVDLSFVHKITVGSIAFLASRAPVFI